MLTPSLTSLTELKDVNLHTSIKDVKPLNISLRSQILNFKMKRYIMEDFSLLIPVANIFEIFDLEINKRIFCIENLKIFGLAALQEKILFNSQSDRIRNSRFIFVLTISADEK
jgi:hypothetical protein